MQFVERGLQYDEAKRIISSTEDKLLDRLSGEEKELLQRQTEAQMERNQLTCDEKSSIRQ